MALLVTGFTPFGGLLQNPSEQILAELPRQIGGHDVRTAVLPVDTNRIADELEVSYAGVPSVAIHLGLARERSVLSLERVALNVLDFPIPDNAGQMREDLPIVIGGPLALASRLPLRAIARAWAARGIPGEISNSAGTYLCNQTMYLALGREPRTRPVGFIHLPPTEIVDLKTQAEAIRLALELCVATIGA